MNRLRKFFRLLFVNLLVLLGLLFLLEALFRLTGKDYGNSPADADPYLNWVHPRDYRFTSFSPSGEFGGFPVYYDREGRRAPLPEPAMPKAVTKSVWLLGDSFTEALQVPYDSSFAGRLAAAAPHTLVLNYGVTGYSPLQYYLLLKKLLDDPGVLPGAVVLTLYSNDVRDDSTLLQRAVYDGTGTTITAINGGTKRSWKALLRRSYVVKNINRVYLQWQYARKHKETGTAAFQNADGIEERPVLENTITGIYLEKIAAMLKARQIAFFLTAIPSRYKTVADPNAGSSFADHVKRWAAAHELPYCDLETGFLQDPPEKRQAYFFRKDIHCTAAGHARIGDLLVPCLDVFIK